MLKMKSTCQRCDAALAADGEAVICSYECTFCRDCGDRMQYRCPNCDGELVTRPRRTRDPLPVAAGLIRRRVRAWLGRS